MNPTFIEIFLCGLILAASFVTPLVLYAYFLSRDKNRLAFICMLLTFVVVVFWISVAAYNDSEGVSKNVYMPHPVIMPTIKRPR